LALVFVDDAWPVLWWVGADGFSAHPPPQKRGSAVGSIKEN
jgi:hypothetical protein